jgi:hypothetical protein
VATHPPAKAGFEDLISSAFEVPDGPMKAGFDDLLSSVFEVSDGPVKAGFEDLISSAFEVPDGPVKAGFEDLISSAFEVPDGPVKQLRPPTCSASILIALQGRGCQRRRARRFSSPLERAIPKMPPALAGGDRYNDSHTARFSGLTE